MNLRQLIFFLLTATCRYVDTKYTYVVLRIWERSSGDSLVARSDRQTTVNE